MKRLCAPQELAEGQSRGFEIEGRKLLAVRKDGQVYAYHNRCPHRGIPLEWLPDQFLDASASLIQCATHGALFLIDSGECVAGPCAGQALEALSCVEDAEGIWVQS
ncbi:Rieske (2Fe-2S) protein [Pseudomonas benzenivorans]|uniref:Rieske (2Fe-2S) protein n=1 Tax=Pseudomonas benzenivorans TaxID=556533 RepID=A0ABY5HCZ7_9PSED|nr:Rieske (2Fe-2S) protein [Pseudomonas benzenivorans]UTW09227.1 Rieske (2Fe-2S) protein [Pseudomonas benzenivorans]